MTITDFRALLDNESPEELLPPIALDGRELEKLISPMSSAEFANNYFARTSLNLEGNTQKFDHIFNWARLRQALARGQKITDKRYNIMASFTGGEDSASSKQMIEADHNQVGELLNAGATICITNIHMADPQLARWAQAIRTQLNFTGTVGINCYVSPNASGLPMHYDKRVATTLQIAGKKRWKFSVKPAKAWPDSNEVFTEGQTGNEVGTLPADMEFREVELNPGDILCLPAGAWHSARGVGFSLALNLYLAPRNFLNQFTPILQEFAAVNEHWRGGQPACVEKIQGNMPQTIANYMRERLDEFYEMAKDAIDNSEALTESWLNALTHNPYTGWQPDPLLSIPDVSPNRGFCVATPPLRFIETQSHVALPCDNGLLKFPDTFAPTLYRIASKTSFTISEILSWQQKPAGLSPNEIMPYLQALYSNGIIKMV